MPVQRPTAPGSSNAKDLRTRAHRSARSSSSTAMHCLAGRAMSHARTASAGPPEELGGIILGSAVRCSSSNANRYMSRRATCQGQGATNHVMRAVQTLRIAPVEACGRSSNASTCTPEKYVSGHHGLKNMQIRALNQPLRRVCRRPMSFWQLTRMFSTDMEMARVFSGAATVSRR